MNSDDTTMRDHELRRALVSTATLTKYSRRRIAPKVMIVSVAAFALVGALTGGAVAAAASRSQAQTAGAIESETEGRQLAKQQDAVLVDRKSVV